MKVLFYLRRDYDFIGALMLYCQYLLYLGMFKHSYSHLHNSLARLSSQWVVSRSTCWCSGCTQCKYLRLFTTEAGRRGSWHQTQAQHHCYFSEYLLWRGTWRPRSRLYHATDAYVPQSTGGPGMLRRRSGGLAFLSHCMPLPLLLECRGWVRLRIDNPAAWDVPFNPWLWQCSTI